MFNHQCFRYVLHLFSLGICIYLIGLLILFRSHSFTQDSLANGNDASSQFLPFVVHLTGTPSPQPTHTPTLTMTATPTLTPSPTNTPTFTPSPTATFAPTATPTFSCPTPEYVWGTQFENFLCGGEEVAYHDNDPVNQGGQYRPDEGVDLAVAIDPPYGDSYYVGWTEAGEWLTYDFVVLYSAEMHFQFRVSSTVSTARFHIEVDGINVTGSVLIPDTGNIQSWETIFLPGSPILLQPGVHTARLVIEEGGGNYNYMVVGLATPIPTPGRP